MAETLAKMDEKGRVTIPEEVREVLDVNNQKAILKLDVAVRKRLEGE